MSRIACLLVLLLSSSSALLPTTLLATRAACFRPVHRVQPQPLGRSAATPAARVAPLQLTPESLSVRGGDDAKEGVVGFAKELVENGMYGFTFALIALLCGGYVDRIFPKFDPTRSYRLVSLLFQIALQAGANAAAAQATRRFIASLPMPNLTKSGKALPASGGGIVFAFTMFSRQSNWKAKVQALDGLLDQTRWFV